MAEDPQDTASEEELWIIDASVQLADTGPPWPFVPVRFNDAGEPYYVTGLTYIGERPPYGRLLGVGLLSEEGDQRMVEEWCERHPQAMELVEAEYKRSDRG